MKIWITGGIVLLLLVLVGGTCARRDNPKAKPGTTGEQVKAAPPAQNMKVGPLRAIAIDSVGISSLHAEFKIMTQTPDPCWKFSHYDVKEHDGKKMVVIYGQRDPSEMCIQMVGTLEVKVVLEVAEAGEYQCQFWCGEAETLDKVVDIPN